MTDPTANQGGQQGQGQQGQGGMSADQLAALQPFQNQLTWVGAQQFQSGKTQGEKELTEKLGMTVEEAVAKLKGQGQGQGQQTGQQSQQQGQQQQGQQGQPDPSQVQAMAELQRRMTELETKAGELDKRDKDLTQRETTIKTQEQDGLRVAALEQLGMTNAQAQVAKSMMPLPSGVTELTPELAKASAEQLKATFPAMFASAEGGQQGGQQQAGGTGGPPVDTHTRGAQSAGSAGGNGQSADERAKARLVKRGHVKPQQS